MLPEIGGLELLLIAIVALIVVGPKDLPIMLRKLGQFTAKLRGMANEFRASFDEMARQSELDELRKEVEAMRRGQFSDTQAAMDASSAQVQQVFGEISDSLNGSNMQFHPPMGSPEPTPLADPEPEATVAEPEAAPVAAAAEAPKPKRARAPKPVAGASATTAAKPRPKATAKSGAKTAAPKAAKPKPGAQA